MEPSRRPIGRDSESLCLVEDAEGTCGIDVGVSAE